MLDIFNHGVEVLAATSDTSTAITNFFKDGIGSLLKTAMGMLGVLVIILTIFNSIKHILGGKIGPAVKTIIGGVIISVFLIAPAPTIGGLINAGTNIVTALTDTVSGVKPTTPAGGSGGSTG